MPRCWLQFRLRTLLLAQIAVAAGIVTYPYWSAIDLRPVVKRPIPWQPFSQAALEEAKASGRPVVVHFDANWSISAKANLIYSLEVPAVRRAIYDQLFIPLRADCTNLDAEAMAALKAHDSASIPLTVIYSPHSPESPILLHDLPTQNQVLTAMNQAAPSDGGRPRWNPFLSPLIGGLGILFLIGLAHVLARNEE